MSDWMRMMSGRRQALKEEYGSRRDLWPWIAKLLDDGTPVGVKWEWRGYKS